MIKYIHDRSKQMRNRILTKAKNEFGDSNIHIFWENKMWWIRVIITKNDVVEYNAVVDENEIDFEIR